MTEQQLFIVQVVEDKTGEIVFESQPTWERRAEKIEDGLSINLDHANFSTKLVEVTA